MIIKIKYDKLLKLDRYTLGHKKLISWFSGPPACGNSSPHCRFYCKNSLKKIWMR